MALSLDLALAQRGLAPAFLSIRSAGFPSVPPLWVRGARVVNIHRIGRSEVLAVHADDASGILARSSGLNDQETALCKESILCFRFVFFPLNQAKSDGERFCWLSVGALMLLSRNYIDVYSMFYVQVALQRR